MTIFNMMVQGEEDNRATYTLIIHSAYNSNTIYATIEVKEGDVITWRTEEENNSTDKD